MLITILIIAFSLLVIFQLYDIFNKDTIIEGLESSSYQAYTDNPGSQNVGTLVQQNTNNIQVLENQIIDASNIILDLSSNISTLNEQVKALVQEQANAAQQLVGTQPLNVT
jgi:hypothetical protein